MYSPLNINTHYSLLRGLSKPEEIANKCNEYGITSCAITDYDNVSGAAAFYINCTKKNIKPLIGTKIYIDNGYVTLIAKNHDGWKEIINISSISHDINHLDNVPKVSFDEISGLKNVIVMFGEHNSIAHNSIIDRTEVYLQSNPEQSLSYFLKSDYENILSELLTKYQSTFKDNLFLSISLSNKDQCKIDGIIASMLRELSQKYKINKVGIPNCVYSDIGHADDHRLLIANHNKINMSELSSSTDPSIYRYIKYNNSHLLNQEEFSQFYTEDECKNTNLVSEMCEEYSVLNKPTLPNFNCPNGKTESEYLRDLCRKGWLERKSKLDAGRENEYVDRIKMELDVFKEANLEGYFLIVHDYIKWARENNVLVGVGRGSSVGCFASYLLGITNADPVIYNLFFERFYNKGRNSPGKVAYPDIDTDFSIEGREKVINYISDKYGKDNVSQVVTFSSLQGKSAVREVLRLRNACSAETISNITKNIPNRAEIDDKLEESKEHSIIRWTLKNEPHLLQDFVVINDDDSLSGDFSSYFEQAIRIEGTYKSYGKHASALVIAREPVSTITPMLNDKNHGNLIAGTEYKYLEQMGLVKFDILGLSTLSKLNAVSSLLLNGNIGSIVLEKEIKDE